MMIVFAATIYSQAIPPDPATIAPVIHPPNPHTNIVLSLADFLVDNNGHGRSPYQAFKLAIEACRQQNAARLIIPTGVYAFNDPQILQDGAHIGLYSLSDLTIDGQGSEFIFHFPIAGFNFDGCHRLLIRNLTLDTDLLLASLGVVQKAGGSTNIRILDAYPINADTPFVAISPYDIQNLKWKGAPGEVFSPRNVTMIGPHLFTSPDFNSLTDGEEVVVRHYTYGGNAFSIPTYLTSDVSFENITIYGAPGMGFYIAGQRGFRLSNCSIMQKPGTQRPVSTAADGSHFTNTAGDILVEDCDFSGQGDDSLNIASLWVPVTQRINSRTVILTRQYNQWIIQQGSEIKFVRRNNLAEICRRHVTQVTYDQSSGRFTTTVDQDLPTDLMVGDLAINLSQNNSRFLIRRNFFHDHRARGMLIQSWNGIIENNRVSHPTWQGIDLFTDGYGFLEGPGPENVIVRNNTFKGCSYGNYGTAGDTMGTVNITADVPGGISDQRIDHNILLDGNVISDTPGLAMFVSSAAGLTITNNVILNSNTLGLFPPWYGSAIGVTPHGSIMITKASSVLLTNNLEVNRYQQPERGIYFDPQTTAGIHIQNNSEASPTTGGILAISGDYLSGSPVTLMAIANPGYSFANWSENGAILSTSSSYTFSLNANRALLASFGASGITQLANISTRAFVQTGDNVVIGGFIVERTGPKRVIIRAIGPELTQYGVPDALANPRLELHNAAGALIGSNDDWQHTIIGGVITRNQINAIQNSGHAPANPFESAIIADLPPGNYTAIVSGVNNTPESVSWRYTI